MLNKEKTSSIIRSVSGLVNYHDLVVGVSDEYHGLFVRGPRGDQFLNFSNYSAEVTYQEQKKLKPDHESLSFVCQDGKDYLMAFPSFSKSNRNEVGWFQVEKVEDYLKIRSEAVFKLPKLFSSLQDHREINIEGHLFFDDQVLVLNRGNQKNKSELIQWSGRSAWLDTLVHAKSDELFDYSISRVEVDLGFYEGYPIHWTDGIWEQDRTILFLATVEKTDNAFDDGEVLASFIGRFNVSTRKMISITKILDHQKAEGICRYNSGYLIAIDSDSPETVNEFYSLPLDILK